MAFRVWSGFVVDLDNDHSKVYAYRSAIAIGELALRRRPFSPHRHTLLLYQLVWIYLSSTLRHDKRGHDLYYFTANREVEEAIKEEEIETNTNAQWHNFRAERYLQERETLKESRVGHVRSGIQAST